MIRFFWIYGTALLLLMAWADFRGWGLTSYNETKGIPKSLRDNPGSYRTIYGRTIHK